MSNKKSKSELSLETNELLTKMGLDPVLIKRESSLELMMPKLALVGSLETISKFCEATKEVILGSPGSLNIPSISMFLKAIEGTVEAAIKIVEHYKTTQLKLIAKETIDTISSSIKISKDNVKKEDSSTSDELDEEFSETLEAFNKGKTKVIN